MATAGGACPSCGATITFAIGASASLVCPYCKAAVARTDRGLENLGKVADVVFSDVALAPGDRGDFHGHPFEVLGRVVYQHSAGGTWEEYFARFDGDHPGWIAEAQGRWTVTRRIEATAPPIESLSVSQQLALGGDASLVVAEIGQGTLLSAEGELPYVVGPGMPRRFVDLSGAGGAVASIDYREDAPPEVYLGVQTTFPELGVVRKDAQAAPPQKVGVREFTCPSCGASLPLHGGNDVEHVACSYCGVVSDVASRTAVMRQEAARRTPDIPLGKRAALYGTEWIVIGYLRRSTVIEGERYHWDEYLLYEPGSGYRWIVVDEGTWLFGSPTPAGDVDASNAPASVVMSGSQYTLRNRSTARVDYVLGEFYWKVAVGETVESEDYERGSSVLSCERSDGEVNWTFSNPLGAKELDALGAWSAAPAPAGLAPNAVGCPPALLVGVLIMGVAIAVAVAIANGGGGGSGGRSGGGSHYGGFGGK